MKVQAYLAFDGNCQEALNFYADCLGAEIKNRQTYADKKIDVPAAYRDRLQHAELKGNGVDFMAYDAAPDTPLTHGTKIHLSIDIDNKEKAQGLFEELSAGGQVHHELREREWNALFARFTDKYGINWMINCDL
ncbi:VOC family protein [Allomuricauda sp. F6463D]|uniref:VOC family protein n=1 Tax=Allomuricauda sp. F6463D TaxID=2926409 RepID=UPI001FF628FC|nr:VOC family protein [Muricauda sp. F6463D]MCK0159165.1 VOC family protein [Muricauda sp. F6463D]